MDFSENLFKCVCLEGWEAGEGRGWEGEWAGSGWETGREGEWAGSGWETGRGSGQDQGIETGLKTPSSPLPVQVAGGYSCLLLVPVTIPGT